MVREEMLNVHNCCACKSHTDVGGGHGGCGITAILSNGEKHLTLALDQKEAPPECPARLGVLFIDEDCMR